MRALSALNKSKWFWFVVLTKSALMLHDRRKLSFKQVLNWATSHGKMGVDLVNTYGARNTTILQNMKLNLVKYYNFLLNGFNPLTRENDVDSFLLMCSLLLSRLGHSVLGLTPHWPRKTCSDTDFFPVFRTIGGVECSTLSYCTVFTSQSWKPLNLKFNSE